MGDRLSAIEDRLSELDSILGRPDIDLQNIENRIRSTYRRNRGVFVIDLSDVVAIRSRNILRDNMDANNREYRHLRAERAKLRQEERMLKRKGAEHEF